MTTIPSVPRRASQSLPGTEALGASTVPGQRSEVQDVPSGIAAQGEVAGGQSVVQGGNALRDAASVLADFTERAEQGNDMMRHIKAQQHYRMQADKITNDFMQRGDLSHPETMVQYGEALRVLDEETVKNWGGRQKALPHLMQMMEGQRSHYTSQVGHAATKATRELMDRTVDERLSPLVQVAINDPAQLKGMTDRAFAEIDSLPISPDQKDYQQRRFLKVSTAGLFNTLVMRGGGWLDSADTPEIDTALELINYMVAKKVFTPEEVVGYNQKLTAALAARERAANQPDVELKNELMRSRIERLENPPANNARVWVTDPNNPDREIPVTFEEAQRLGLSRAARPSDDPYKKKFDEKTGEADAARYTKLSEMAERARADDFVLKNYADQLRAGARTGAAANVRKSLGQWGEYLGIPGLDGIIGKAGQLELTDSMASMITKNFVDRAPRMTNMLLADIQKLVPKNTNTPGGNLQIITLLRTWGMHEMARAAEARKYLAAGGNPRALGDHLDVFSKTNDPFDAKLMAQLKQDEIDGQRLGKASGRAMRKAGAGVTDTQKEPSGFRIPPGGMFVGMGPNEAGENVPWYRIGDKEYAGIPLKPGLKGGR